MKYFFDTEFLEGPQTKFGFWKTKPTIDLVSIGIVDEGGREYYAVSNEFNLKEAWNRYQTKIVGKKDAGLTPVYEKEYWIRENVLKPIWLELLSKSHGWNHKVILDGLKSGYYTMDDFDTMTYGRLKKLIKAYGKSNKVIASEILNFTTSVNMEEQTNDYVVWMATHQVNITQPEFYAYYADYDWVVFCWLFGTMMQLPSGYPMYCIDLKQMLDRQVSLQTLYYNRDIAGTMTYKDRPATFEEKLDKIKKFASYPKETNEHHSLADARWTKALYEFINKRLV